MLLKTFKRVVASKRGQLAPSLGQRHASSFQRQPFRLSRPQAVVGVSAVTLLVIGAGALLTDAATHMWLERNMKRAKRDIDSDTREWGWWDLEAERWTGDPSQGGTDPALGRQGRKLVRDAWFSHHGPENYAPIDEDDKGANDLNTVDAVLLRTELCLRGAIAIAESPDIAPKLHPCTLIDLLSRRAAILERLGPFHLGESRAEYERVWGLLAGKGIQAARVAVKLGDINQRLGEGPDALAWWARAVQLASGGQQGALEPAVPTTPPSSPASQRVLASALVSTSAFYAMARQLSQAQKIEQGSLDLLRSIRPPESLASASPPQALHSLSLLHRSAILSLHLGEVFYAANRAAECLQSLQAAATSSERVACALVGASAQDSEQPAPRMEEPLLPGYIKNPYLEKPARDLLRDARRSAADTWNLMGELTERMGPSHRQLAFKYYQRAIFWAGRTNGEGTLEPADLTLRDDWTLMLRNYTRMREATEPKCQ
ncbi:hypothetical protein B0H17DRAFT_1029748 [Mycena rosella]|uniref:Uncharacterized protein n=1 Tax=Mycena rosella TaxID=1033263 RepID=A0AAD7H1V2_MYCRO|nr:hypothetical protein B0H17DRAFT_1029748 [Mycena rosella]